MHWLTGIAIHQCSKGWLHRQVFSGPKAICICLLPSAPEVSTQTPAPCTSRPFSSPSYNHSQDSSHASQKHLPQPLMLCPIWKLFRQLSALSGQAIPRQFNFTQVIVHPTKMPTAWRMTIVPFSYAATEPQTCDLNRAMRREKGRGRGTQQARATAETTAGFKAIIIPSYKRRETKLLTSAFHFVLFQPYLHGFSSFSIVGLPFFFYFACYLCVIDGVWMLMSHFPFFLNGSAVGFYFLGRSLRAKCWRKRDKHSVIHSFWGMLWGSCIQLWGIHWTAAQV